MRSLRIAGALLALGTCAGIGVSIAEEEFDPQPIIEGRQAALRDIGGAFKGISDELKVSSPSIPTISHYARQIDDLSRQQKFWFPAGTGPEAEIETRAKPEIWQSPEEFRKAQSAFSEHVQKLVKAAESGNVATIQAQWRELGKSCKGCHDRFREEED
ncbi:cytochrome c556 [Povalibacter uvarum]|uniref:Cytochrome c556 n=1 Tax=Povalibacter uvarum TaxID=732238 RepID=A0A841HLD1_9GAMM|nr:cytochrome c [Povalibacter uvarum]MBB6094011.1 cytochrome c556 [Povalibacter uvarum]